MKLIFFIIYPLFKVTFLNHRRIILYVCCILQGRLLVKTHAYTPQTRTNQQLPPPQQQSSQPQQQSSQPQQQASQLANNRKRWGLPRKYICDYFNTQERKCFCKKINKGKSCIDQGNITLHHVCSVEVSPDTYCRKQHHVSEHTA